MLEDLNIINMADYKNLYKFILWGIEIFSAKKYMLIIAGHGFNLINLSDLCGDTPYTMGLYELCLAIREIEKNLKVEIDILNFDICNMNNIEVIYELAKNNNNPHKYMMTYINNGPLSGMNYGKLFESLDSRDIKDILREMIINSEMDIVAVKINNKILKNIKSLTNKLGYEELIKLKDNNHSDNLKNKYLNDISKEIEKIVVEYNFVNEPRQLINKR